MVDTSFFVSSAAVNPTLTTVANAMRVGDHLIDRLGASVTPDPNAVHTHGRAHKAGEALA